MMPSRSRQILIKVLIWFFFGSLVLPPSTEADQAQYFYDELGRLQAVMDGQGNMAVYTYDAVGNLLSITRRGTGEVSILTVLPSSGKVGTPVTINGFGFAAVPGDNHVTFGGGVAASVLSSTTTSIATVVPDGAASGPITVATPAGSATSPHSFIVPPAITAIAPSYGFQASTITEFRITGTNLQASNAVQFAPSDGVSVSNPPKVSADGTSATVSVTIAATASLVPRTVTIRNAGGVSTDTDTPENRFLVLPNQPFVATSNPIGVFVEPSAEAAGTLVYGTNPTVGVFVEPSAEAAGTLIYGTNPTVGVFVEPSAEEIGTTILAPYVGVRTSP